MEPASRCYQVPLITGRVSHRRPQIGLPGLPPGAWTIVGPGVVPLVRPL